MSVETYGERVFRQYLEANGMKLDHEPEWTHTLSRPEYRIPHPLGDVVLEIKDIESDMFGEARAGAYDPYEPIRNHIDAARRKFKHFADFACVLALKAGRNAFVDLETPHIMLGAMYGDYGWKIPFNIETGLADSSQIRPEFIQGRGKMLHLRRDGLVKHQNTRISAILTIHDYPATRGADNPGVTVWENAYACRKLPDDLFKSKMDRWYGVDQYQSLSFEGEGIAPEKIS